MIRKDVLIDTNILIYGQKNTGDFYTKSVRILQNLDYNLFLTSKNVSELFAVLTKHEKSWKLILAYFDDIKRNMKILYPDEQSLSIFKQLCSKYQPKGNQVFDMEIISIMLANNIDTVATFNYKDFKDIEEIRILDECL